MINVVDKETIRKLYHVQGKSIRWIARELGFARQTEKTQRDGSFVQLNQHQSINQNKPVRFHVDRLATFLAAGVGMVGSAKQVGILPLPGQRPNTNLVPCYLPGRRHGRIYCRDCCQVWAVDRARLARQQGLVD
ncbi:MAG: hypothetical protein KBA08_01705 [Firmicutes bacterium]|nr:hypothetical protein [Bacillota bacterium]